MAFSLAADGSSTNYNIPLTPEILTRSAGALGRQHLNLRSFNSNQLAAFPIYLLIYFCVPLWQKPESQGENDKTNATIIIIMPPPTGEHQRLFKYFPINYPIQKTLHNRHFFFCFLLPIILIIFYFLPNSYCNFCLPHSSCIVKSHLKEL